eukprot:1023255-Pelagomonas_calceolata.AAC.2
MQERMMDQQMQERMMDQQMQECMMSQQKQGCMQHICHHLSSAAEVIEPSGVGQQQSLKNAYFPHNPGSTIGGKCFSIPKEVESPE